MCVGKLGDLYVEINYNAIHTKGIKLIHLFSTAINFGTRKLVKILCIDSMHLHILLLLKLKSIKGGLIRPQGGGVGKLSTINKLRRTFI